MENILEAQSDQIMQEDIDAIANGDFPAEKLNKSTVLVTGSTGLIGSQVVKTLAAFNRVKGTDIKIIAYARSEEKAKKVFGRLLERGDVSVALGDVNEPIKVDADVDYIIHGASATSSKYFVSNPVETIATAMNGTTNILEFQTRQMALSVKRIMDILILLM